MCIIWLKAQTEQVSLQMPCSYLLVISKLKHHSTVSSRTFPSHQQIQKASWNVHIMLQAKQNWAAGFVNTYLVWCNDHYCSVVWHQEFEQEELYLLCCKLKSQQNTVHSLQIALLTATIVHMVFLSRAAGRVPCSCHPAVLLTFLIPEQMWHVDSLKTATGCLTAPKHL